MKEEEFLDSIEDLTGRVAIVTGGAKGIGLETAIYLSSKGATVYIAARNSEGTQAGVEEARKQLGLRNVTAVAAAADGDGHKDETENDNTHQHEERIKYHELDLGSMQDAWESAQEFKKIEDRLDILVCNAGVSMTTMQKLSPDGYDTMFTVNHLSHFAFTMGLLDLISRTAGTTHDSRIVFTNSNAYKKATKLDYEKLSTPVPNDGQRLKDIADAFTRYAASKLAGVYSTLELSSRLRQNGIKDVYMNSCHPGNAIGTTLGTGHQAAVNPTMERMVRSTLDVTIGNSTADSAKTQVFLAGSKYVKEHDTHGEFWSPSFSVLRRSYKGSGQEEYTVLGKDEKEREKLWSVTVEAFNKAVGEEAIDSAEIVRNIIGKTN